MDLKNKKVLVTDTGGFIGSHLVECLVEMGAATKPFIKWIKKADLVLLDYPSTALYEAAVSGLPVMSLFFAPFNIIRESTLKLFGRSLQPFSTFDEGIAKIDNLLNSNLNEFIVSIPRSEKSIPDIVNRDMLESLKSSKTKYKE